MQTIKSLGVLSVGKIMGILYAVVGLLAVPFVLLFSAVGALAGERAAGFGLASAIVFTVFIPVFYGVIGFIAGVIFAFLYNVIAERLGGIEVELESAPQVPQVPAAPLPEPPIAPDRAIG